MAEIKEKDVDIDLTGCLKVPDIYVEEILLLRETELYSQLSKEDRQIAETKIINRFLETLSGVEYCNAKL